MDFDSVSLTAKRAALDDPSAEELPTSKRRCFVFADPTRAVGDSSELVRHITSFCCDDTMYATTAVCKMWREAVRGLHLSKEYCIDGRNCDFPNHFVVQRVHAEDFHSIVRIPTTVTELYIASNYQFRISLFDSTFFRNMPVLKKLRLPHGRYDIGMLPLTLEELTISRSAQYKTLTPLSPTPNLRVFTAPHSHGWFAASLREITVLANGPTGDLSLIRNLRVLRVETKDWSHILDSRLPEGLEVLEMRCQTAFIGVKDSFYPKSLKSIAIHSNAICESLFVPDTVDEFILITGTLPKLSRQPRVFKFTESYVNWQTIEFTSELEEVHIRDLSARNLLRLRAVLPPSVKTMKIEDAWVDIADMKRCDPPAHTITPRCVMQFGVSQGVLVQ